MSDEQEKVVGSEEVIESGNKRRGRKAAPAITMVTLDGDARKARLDMLDKQNPDCVHVYQKSDITQDELDAKGLEKVPGQRFRNDCVCRTDRKAYEAWRQSEVDGAYHDVKGINKQNTRRFSRMPKRRTDGE